MAPISRPTAIASLWSSPSLESPGLLLFAPTAPPPLPAGRKATPASAHHLQTVWRETPVRASASLVVSPSSATSLTVS